MTGNELHNYCDAARWVSRRRRDQQAGGSDGCYIPLQSRGEMRVPSVNDAWRAGRDARVSSRKYPAKGAQAKRKSDGLVGQVYVSSPTKDLVAVRWQKTDETGTLLYDIEQFSHEWELIRTSGAKLKVPAGAMTIVAVCAIGLCGIGFFGLRAWESTRASRVAAAARQQAGRGRKNFGRRWSAGGADMLAGRG